MHSLPVGQMGNYQEYLKRFTPPLREIESIPVRQHMFGNPFKIDKVSTFPFVNKGKIMFIVYWILNNFIMNSMCE